MLQWGRNNGSFIFQMLIFANRVKIIGNRFGWTNFQNYEEWQTWAHNQWSKKEFWKMRLCFNVTIDMLWRERNNCIHDEGAKNEQKVLPEIIAMIIFWVNCSKLYKVNERV